MKIPNDISSANLRNNQPRLERKDYWLQQRGVGRLGCGSLGGIKRYLWFGGTFAKTIPEKGILDRNSKEEAPEQKTARRKHNDSIVWLCSEQHSRNHNHVTTPEFQRLDSICGQSS